MAKNVFRHGGSRASHIHALLGMDAEGRKHEDCGKNETHRFILRKTEVRSKAAQGARYDTLLPVRRESDSERKGRPGRCARHWQRARRILLGKRKGAEGFEAGPGVVGGSSLQQFR